MVWYQYVWEATTGNEAEWSDDEHAQHQEPVHVDDWLDFNSDELDYLWTILQEYMYDAGSRLLAKMGREDFARFCFDPPAYREGQFDVAFWIDTHEEALAHMWRLLTYTKSTMIRQTTYETFAHFCYRYR